MTTALMLRVLQAGPLDLPGLIYRFAWPFFLQVKFIFPQNLVNTATIHAATENKDSVGMSDFEWAYDKQVIPSCKSKS